MFYDISYGYYIIRLPEPLPNKTRIAVPPMLSNNNLNLFTNQSANQPHEPSRADNTTQQVYVPDADAAWARASVLSNAGGTVYEVRIDGIDDNDEAGTSDWGAGEVRRVDLAGTQQCLEVYVTYHA